MNDWLDTFNMMGIGLSEGEKSLMRFAMKKERERIIKLLEASRNFCTNDDGYCFEWCEMGDCECKKIIALIKGEQNAR